MNIHIIAVGKLKERFWKDAVKEYEKRLGKYCRLQISEIPDEKAPESLSASQEEEVKRREGDRILRAIREGDYCIALVIQGESLTSEDLAARLDRLAIGGRSNITFVIGGSLGLSREVLARADMYLSFSSFTFAHQLMRVILLEQLFRSFKIIKGEPYHK